MAASGCSPAPVAEAPPEAATNPVEIAPIQNAPVQTAPVQIAPVASASVTPRPTLASATVPATPPAAVSSVPSSTQPLTPSPPAVASMPLAAAPAPLPPRNAVAATTAAPSPRRPSSNKAEKPADMPRPELEGAVAVDCSQTKREVLLAEPAAKLFVAAGGKRLVAYLKQARKAAVIDVERAEVVKEIALPAGGEPMAADRANLALYDAGRKRISLVDLESGNEVESLPWTEGEVTQMLMGCDASGPLAITEKLKHESRTWFYDTRTMRPLATREPREVIAVLGYGPRVSADGMSYLRGERGSHHDPVFELAVAGSRGFAPDSQRSYFPTSQDVWESYREAREIAYKLDDADHRPDATLNLMAIFRNKYGDDRAADPTKGLVEFHRFEERDVLFTLAGVELPTFQRRMNLLDRGNGSFDRFIPLLAVSAVVTVPNETDRIVIHRFPLEETLKLANRERPFVISTLPEPMRAGEKWTHRLKTISTVGGLRYRVEHGPAAMKIDADGTLEWTPTEAECSSPVDVVVSIRDAAGHELFQRIGLMPYPGLFEARRSPGVAATTGSRTSPPPKDIGPPREMKELALPGKITTVAVGGSGRYVLAYLEELDKVVAIDVVKREVAYEVGVDHDADLQIAASADKFFTAAKTKHVITRYDLKTGAKEKSVTIPGTRIGSIAIGCASDGPLFVSALRGPAGTPTQMFNQHNFDIDFYDVATLAPKTTTFEPRADKTNLGHWCASADGTVFTHVNGAVLSLFGTTVRRHQCNSSGYYSKPSADGRVLHCDASMWNRDESPLDRPPGINASNFIGRFIPSATGPYFTNFLHTSRSGSGAGRYMIHPQGEYQPLVTLEGIEEFNRVDGDQKEGKYIEPVIGFLPEAEAFVAIRQSRDAICIYRVKLDEELAKTPIDYMFVDSSAPKTVGPGKKFEYRVVGKTKQGTPTYTLTTAPKGMTLAPDGTLNWDSSTAAAGSTQEVAVTVKSPSGQELVHRFRFVVGIPPVPKPKGPDRGRF
jgi:hypothetical protein